MEMNKATIKREDPNAFLVLHINEQEYKIILTEDNPNNIKSVFNELLKELKNGVFSFELEDDKEDLFHHVSKEYLIQLNAELVSVFDEMSSYGLISD